MTAPDLDALAEQIRALQAECDGNCSAGFELAGIALALVERVRTPARAPNSAPGAFSRPGRVDTAAIRDRANAADAGPWRALNDQFSDIEHRKAAVARWSEKHDPKDRLWVVESDAMAAALIGGERSARFIAAARTDVPALCDRVEALEAALRDIATRAANETAVADHLDSIRDAARAALVERLRQPPCRNCGAPCSPLPYCARCCE